jgi:putative ABC transport system substrate-binding protein
MKCTSLPLHTRRELIRLLGGAATMGATAVRAEQPGMPVVGWLGSGTVSSERHLLTAFEQGLADGGFAVGRDVVIEYNAATGRYDHLPAMAAELVRHKVAIIAASGPPAALAAKDASATIPIVFVIGYDPVEFGLVGSLNRPGGNLTGATFFTGALGSKRLDLALRLAPDAHKIGMLVNPNTPTAQIQVQDMQAAADALGREIYVLNASGESELETAFQAFVDWGGGVILVGGDPVLMSHREKLVSLTAHYSLPAIYDRREYVEVGGLLSYGTSLSDPHRKIGLYASRILKGEKPADLPIQRSTKFELVINLKTAKTLRLDIPSTLLAIADEFIE